MKLLTTLLILILVPVSVSFGGENAFFFGGGYDDGIKLAYGTAIDLGNNFWNIDYASAGKSYGDVNTEISYIRNIYKGLSVGVLLGPNADIRPGGDNGELITYLVGASGGLITYDFGLTGDQFSNVGLWLCGKYKFSCERDNLYPDGWALYGGIYVWW